MSLLNLYQFGVLSVILAWTTSGFAKSLEDAVAAWRQRDVAKTFSAAPVGRAGSCTSAVEARNDLSHRAKE